MTTPAGRHDGLERSLRELLDKQAIREVCLIYARATERRDAEALATVFHDDAIYEHFQAPPARANGSAREFADKMVAEMRAAPIKVKGLMIPSTLVELEGDVAFAESLGLSLNPMEINGEQVTYLRTLRYLDRFERRDGEWRIAHRIVLHGGYERFEAAAPSPFVEHFAPGGQSLSHPDDLLYQMRERLRPEAVPTAGV